MNIENYFGNIDNLEMLKDNPLDFMFVDLKYNIEDHLLEKENNQRINVTVGKNKYDDILISLW